MGRLNLVGCLNALGHQRIDAFSPKSSCELKFHIPLLNTYGGFRLFFFLIFFFAPFISLSLVHTDSLYKLCARGLWTSFGTSSFVHLCILYFVCWCLIFVCRCCCLLCLYCLLVLLKLLGYHLKK